MRHWQEFDPARFQAIEDPQEFFTTLGAEVEQEIETLAAALAGPDRVGETYLEKVGRLNMARLQAEEAVLSQLIWISEPQADEETQEPDPMIDFYQAIKQANDEGYQEELLEAEREAKSRSDAETTG